MRLRIQLFQSLKTRILCCTLFIFLISIWSLTFYVGQILHSDVEKSLSERQLLAAEMVAGQINNDLNYRQWAIESIGAISAKAMQEGPQSIQAVLDQRPLLQNLFNEGIIICNTDGTAIAELPLSAGRVGINYMNVDVVAAALKKGKSTIGAPIIGKRLKSPVFGMAAPIRDHAGTVIGVIAALTNVGIPNFLDKIADVHHEKTGGFLLVAPQQRLILAATDKSRVTQALPAKGMDPLLDRLLDRLIDGYEGSDIEVNPQGVEVLSSVKHIPASAWYVEAYLSTHEAFAPIRTVLWRIVLVTLLLTLFMTYLTWRLLKHQFAPMVDAARTLTIFSKTGQLAQLLPVVRQDEIGELINAFNSQMEHLMRRKAELMEREAHFRSFLESVQLIGVMLDREGRITLCNDCMLALTGWTREAVLGKSFDQFLSPELRSRANVEAFQKAIMAGELLPQNENVIITCQGARHLIAWTNTLYRDANGQITAVAIIGEDITLRKQNEDALRIAAIAFEAQAGIAVTDASMKILRVNQAFTKITGYTQDELEGKSPAIMRSDRHPESLYESIRIEMIKKGVWEGDMWRRRKSGEEYLEHLVTTAVTDANGRVTHCVVSITDATSLQMREQQRLSIEAAHRVTLVREVHHRVKNNLQGITGLLRQFPKTFPEMADPIEQAIGQINSIAVIHGLQGNVASPLVKLCELTRAIAYQIQDVWLIPVVLDMPAFWNPRVIAESEAVPIALILNEVIMNAVKHGGAEDSVRITIRKGKTLNSVQIEIINSFQASKNLVVKNTERNGLQLITALMPPQGASISRDQQDNFFITTLVFDPPIISLLLNESE